jgi:hypothetical protein
LHLRKLPADPSAATVTVAPGLTPTRQRQRIADALIVDHEEIEQEGVHAAVDKEAKKRAKAQATKAHRALNKKPKRKTKRRQRNAIPAGRVGSNPSATAWSMQCAPVYGQSMTD